MGNAIATVGNALQVVSPLWVEGGSLTAGDCGDGPVQVIYNAAEVCTSSPGDYVLPSAYEVSYDLTFEYNGIPTNTFRFTGSFVKSYDVFTNPYFLNWFCYYSACTPFFYDSYGTILFKEGCATFTEAFTYTTPGLLLGNGIPYTSGENGSAGAGYGPPGNQFLFGLRLLELGVG